MVILNFLVFLHIFYKKKLVLIIRKQYEDSSEKLGLELPYDLVIAHLGLYPREMKTLRSEERRVG